MSDPPTTRFRSRLDLNPGDLLIHRDGGFAVIDRRKEDDSGWWVKGGGGLADFVAEDPSMWVRADALNLQRFFRTFIP